MTRSYSLQQRLLLTAGLVPLVFLGLMGIGLDQAFQRTSEQGVAERLRIQIYGLLSVAEVSQQALSLPKTLQEPRFNHPGSGLFALVMDKTGRELWRSPSAVDLQLNPVEKVNFYTGLKPGLDRFQRLVDQQLFSLSYKVLWLGPGDAEAEYTFVVVETLTAYQNQLGRFRNNLWGWLLGVVVVLMVVQGLVMKWGLTPLNNLAVDLKAIEDGQQAYLHGVYPQELDGVTKNLNLLLTSERQQREKYRTTLSDLAHSLKTPLAILTGSADQLRDQNQAGLADIQQVIDAQVVRMNQIVGYQLERAVTKSSQLLTTPIAVAPIIEKLVNAMGKVYQDKHLIIQRHVQPCTFFGDERDLLELLGNLVDNACKYSHQVVKIEVAYKGSDLLLTVEDDGEGLPEADQAKILDRGMRLDTKTPGQGIGLAVVGEIVARYGGQMTLASSSLGGAKFTVKFS